MNKNLTMLNNAIKEFNEKFNNNKYKIYTNAKTYVLSFDEESFINLTHLKVAIETPRKKGTPKITLESISKQILFNSDIKVKDHTLEKSVINASYITSNINFNINNVHSFINLRYKKYLLLKNDEILFILGMEYNGEDEENEYYRIKSINSADGFSDKFFLNNIKIDLPYKIEKFVYKDDVEYKKNVEKLLEDKYEERIHMLREYAYFDSNDNDRKNDDYLDISELVERVPIIK